jgi:hypothetical protein
MWRSIRVTGRTTNVHIAPDLEKLERLVKTAEHVRAMSTKFPELADSFSKQIHMLEAEIAVQVSRLPKNPEDKA